MIRFRSLNTRWWFVPSVAGILLGLVLGSSWNALAQRNSSNMFPLTSDQTNLTLGSGQMLLPAGTAALPSLSLGAASTGLASPSAGNVIWSDQGAARGGFGTGLGVGLANNYLMGWGSGTTYVGGAFDTGFARSAAGVAQVNNGTAGTLRDFNARSISLGSTTVSGSSPGITIGSGTGVTVNAAADVRTVWYKVSVTFANCIAAATTCDVVVATLPAKTLLDVVFLDLTTAYVCAATCTTATISATLGSTAGGSELLATMDFDAAAALFGDSNAELGTSMNAAARAASGAAFGGVLFSWTAPTTLTLRITSAVGNVGTGAASNFNAGGFTVYLLTHNAP